MLLGHFLHLVGCALLEDAAILFLVLAGVGSLHTLGLDKVRLTELLVLGLVLGELLILPLLSYLDLGLVKGLAHKDLEDRSSLLLKIED